MSRLPRAALAVLWLALGAAGCGDCGVPPVEEEPDAGGQPGGPDGGPAPDGGSAVLDSGVFEDGGLLDEPDAGRLADGGCPGELGGNTAALLSGLNLARRIAVDDTHVYVSETGALTPDDPTGRLLRAPLDGGALEPLLDPIRTPDALALDATHVYVATGDGVWAVNKADKSKLRINVSLSSTSTGDSSLALTTTQVVFATARNTLVRFGKDGSAQAFLYQGPLGAVVRGAVVEGGYVHFLVTAGAASGLYRVLLDGSAPAERVQPLPPGTRAFLLTPTRLVWAEGGTGTGKVSLAPREGGAVVELANGLSGPTRPVLVGGQLYFKDATLGTESAQFFLRASLCSPGTVAPVGPIGAGPGDLVLKDGRLYFSSQASSTGYVRRIP